MNDHNPAALSLRASRLELGYDGHTVVADVNVEVHPGESLALMGANGSGKSTLLKTIVGLQPTLGGELQVLGGKPGGSPGRVAYLSQFHSSGFVLPLRAVDVVRMGRFSKHGLLGRLTQEDEDLVQTAMHTMGVDVLADSPLRAMSGGQQQRVYLAQVLASRADLLVLDEPAAGLDAPGRETYSQAMRAELARGASVITATHDIQEAGDCGQVLLLAHRVVAVGPCDEVLTPETLLEAFGIVLTHRGDRHVDFAVLEREHPHDIAEPPR